MEKGQTSKYLKYAIGEILLVVIGILIALQINNWNEAKKADKKEAILLNQMRDNFKANLQQLENKMAMRNEIMRSSKLLLQTGDNKLEQPRDTLIFHLQRTLYTPTFNSNTDDFFTSREINLLKNDSLKVLLSQWPTKVDELTEEEMVLLYHREDRYIPYLSKYIKMRDLYNMVEKDLGIKNLIYPKDSKPLDVIIGMSPNSKGYSELLASEDLENHLSYIILFTNIAQTQSVPLKRHIELIIDQIELRSQELR